MLEAVPRHLFSYDFVVRSASGDVATLDVALWRERAEFELDGVPYRMYREGLMSGAFILERAGFPIATAAKPSAFRAAFELETGGRSYSLRRLSIFSRHFGLFSGDTQIGSVRPASIFTRRTLIELPRDWSPALQLFVFWLALVIWKREEAAAAN